MSVWFAQSFGGHGGFAFSFQPSAFSFLRRSFLSLNLSRSRRERAQSYQRILLLAFGLRLSAFDIFFAKRFLLSAFGLHLLRRRFLSHRGHRAIRGFAFCFWPSAFSFCVGVFFAQRAQSYQRVLLLAFGLRLSAFDIFSQSAFSFWPSAFSIVFFVSVNIFSSS